MQRGIIPRFEKKQDHGIAYRLVTMYTLVGIVCTKIHIFRIITPPINL
jgi:hypothetical protein